MPRSPLRSAENIERVYELIIELENCTNLFGPGDSKTVAAATSLATAFWRVGEVDQAISLLRGVLPGSALSSGSELSARDLVLSKLSEICFSQGRLTDASHFQRELMESHIREYGPNDPKALEAKGDLAVILFASGDDVGASRLEQEAFDAARSYIEKAHRVRCVLAWNRVLSLERCGDQNAALRIVVDELVWLLSKEPQELEGIENAIRKGVSERLNWDRPRVC